jgi:hypothetical protein
LKDVPISVTSTGSGRNSEVIINTNNTVLKVINDNFSKLQFTNVLKFVLRCFTLLCMMVLGGHHPPECTGAHEKLRITAGSVSSEMFEILSYMACMSAFKSTGHLLYTLLFT